MTVSIKMLKASTSCTGRKIGESKRWKVFFLLHEIRGCVLWVDAAASDGTDSADCFRITNSSYEYVKWLNGENEVQIQREGEREMKTCIGPAVLALVYAFHNKFPRNVALL